VGAGGGSIGGTCPPDQIKSAHCRLV
jgi:hypothetical protein